jgi:hypothetical protein
MKRVKGIVPPDKVFKRLSHHGLVQCPALSAGGSAELLPAGMGQHLNVVRHVFGKVENQSNGSRVWRRISHKSV